MSGTMLKSDAPAEVIIGSLRYIPACPVVYHREPELGYTNGFALNGDGSLSLPTLTFEEYLSWRESDEDIYCEWENGRIVPLPMPNLSHQNVNGFLYKVLSTYTETKELGGQVVIAPYTVKLDVSGREPDIIYVAPENIGRLGHRFLAGAADIIVEIVSPDRKSVKRDRETKFSEYERNGVREYWLIDPEAETAEFYRRDETNRFYRVPLEQDIFKSMVLVGFELNVEWLWQDPKPPLIDIMRTWEVGE